MKIKTILFLLILCLFNFLCLFNLLSYDEEDNVNSITKLSTIEHHIFDIYLNSPLNTYSPAINFRTGHILTDDFRLGLYGSFFNTLDKSTRLYSKEYYDNEGNKSSIKSEIGDEMFDWSNIKNTLNSYFSWRYLETVSFGFLLGGGTNFDKYKVVTNSYDLHYNNNSELIINDEEKNGVYKSSKIYNGYGKLDTGFGATIYGDLFGVDLINVIRASEIFNFKINGNGSNANLIVLNNNGISNQFLNGNGSTFYEKRTYYVNNTNKEIKYTVTHDEKFNYFGFENSGYCEIELDFHKINKDFALYDRFRFIPGLGYNIGFNYYISSYDNEIRKYSNYYGYSFDDYENKKTLYNFDYDITFGLITPLVLEIKPINSVQLKFYYTLDFDSRFIKYRAQYSEKVIRNKIDQSFFDPIVTCYDYSYDFSHKIGAKFRFEFPKFIRLTIGAMYNLEHNIYNNKYVVSDNTRVYSSGKKGSAPYYIESSLNYNNSYPHNNPKNVNSFFQYVEPVLELDIEYVKDFSTLTIGWNPLIKWDNNNPANNEIISSNILNLANWSIGNVIKFSPKKIFEINSINKSNIQREDTGEQLVIIHTNDTHGHPLSEQGGGLPARLTYIKEIRKNYKNVLVLDAGDINSGMPESNYFNAEPDIIGYNIIGYDAMCIGNHEFDIPVENLQKQMKLAKFPFLSANIKTKDGKDFAKSYIIKKFNNFTVGIFGLTTKDTEIIGNKNNIKNVKFLDEVEVAKKIVKELKEKKVDIIIALTHMGIYDSDEIGVRRIACEVPGIDLIVDGHSHSKLSQAFYVNNVPIIQAWKNGKIVGKAILNIKNKKVTNLSWEPVPLNIEKIVRKEDGTKKVEIVGKKIEEDKGLLLKLKKYKDKVEILLSEVIGNAGGDFLVSKVRKEETPIGNLVCDAMKWFTKEYNVDFCIQNSGGIRADILYGAITKKNIYEVLPFDNTITIVTLKGDNVLKLFNYISKIRIGNGAFPQFSDGVKVTINTQYEIFEDLTINGEKVDINKEYKIAINSFMFEGGDGYDIFSKAIDVYDTSKYQRDVLIEYIKYKKVIIPEISERIKIKE